MPGWLAILSHILTGLPQRESLQASVAEFTTASSTLRFLVGLCQGAVCPVMDCMNRPPNERENGLSGVGLPEFLRLRSICFQWFACVAFLRLIQGM